MRREGCQLRPLGRNGFGPERSEPILAVLSLSASLGLVTRRKRAGTRVESAKPTAGYRQPLASIEDLIQFGSAHRRVVRKIENVVAGRALAQELGCIPGRRWLRISSLRRRACFQPKTGDVTCVQDGGSRLPRSLRLPPRRPRRSILPRAARTCRSSCSATTRGT